MRRKYRVANQRSSYGSEGEDAFIEAFEHECARLLDEKGLEAAKAFFREHFMVQCFACGYLGRTVAPLNCALCGMYLD